MLAKAKGGKSRNKKKKSQDDDKDKDEKDDDSESDSESDDEGKDEKSCDVPKVPDIKKAEEYSKKPPLFKKLFKAGSVEEEAMQAFLAKKKAEDMRAELREIISFSRGPSAWNELLKTEADIRKKRQEAIYNQEERQKKFFEVIAIILACLLCVAVVGGIIYLIMIDRGMM